MRAAERPVNVAGWLDEEGREVGGVCQHSQRTHVDMNVNRKVEATMSPMAKAEVPARAHAVRRTRKQRSNESRSRRAGHRRQRWKASYSSPPSAAATA
eukprot:3544565-Prymnesium_polylepis.2